MRRIVQHAGFIAVFGLIVTSAGSAVQSETGTIRGVARSAVDGTPLGYANVVVVGHPLGAMTLEDGSFEIPNVPVGSHVIKAMCLGYNTWEMKDLTVEPDAALELDIELHKWGMSDAEAARIRIGDQVNATSAEFWCELFPASNRFKVGDAPSFDVRIWNNSGEAVVLVRAVDRSTEGYRYPHALLSIEGPSGGFHVQETVGCGNVNSLDPRDFEEVRAGGGFDPYSSWEPNAYRYGEFTKPGRYAVTFTYSTLAGDVREWQGYPPQPRISAWVADQLRRVPRIVVTKTIVVDVYP